MTPLLCAWLNCKLLLPLLPLLPLNFWLRLLFVLFTLWVLLLFWFRFCFLLIPPLLLLVWLLLFIWLRRKSVQRIYVESTSRQINCHQRQLSDILYEDSSWNATSCNGTHFLTLLFLSWHFICFITTGSPSTIKRHLQK